MSVIFIDKVDEIVSVRVSELNVVLSAVSASLCVPCMTMDTWAMVRVRRGTVTAMDVAFNSLMREELSAFTSSMVVSEFVTMVSPSSK